jgi:hypothetical protein
MDNSSTQLLFDNDQFWVLLIGAIVPLGGYFINKIMPWKTETVKAITQVVLTSIAATGYSALATDIGGFTPFVQQAFSATVAGLFAHNILWKPSNVNIKCGAVPTPVQGASMTSEQIKALSDEQREGLKFPAKPLPPEPVPAAAN